MMHYFDPDINFIALVLEEKIEAKRGQEAGPPYTAEVWQMRIEACLISQPVLGLLFVLEFTGIALGLQ